MTIKILKQGRLPEEVTYKFLCNNCVTEFTAQKKDCKVGSGQRVGNWLEVACPICQYKCTSWNEYKEPERTHASAGGVVWPRGGWNDYILEFQNQPFPGLKNFT